MISVSGGQSVDINFFKMFRSGLFERFFLKKKTGTRCYKRDKIWGNANSLFRWLFRSRCCRCCLSFLFLCVERKGWGGGGGVGVWWKGPGGAYLLSPSLGNLSSDIFERPCQPEVNLFSCNMPWHYQICCIAKCLFSYVFKITAQECKKHTSGWRASLKNVAG